MDGVVRQLYDYDGSNLFPRTKPSAFVSDLYDSSATGINTIGELIDSSIPGEYRDPATDTSVDYEPEFIYRIPRKGSDSALLGEQNGTLKAVKLTQVSALHFDARLTENITVSYQVGQATIGKEYPAGTLLENIIRDMLTGGASIYDVKRNLPGISFDISYSSDGIDYYSLINDQTITANTGETGYKVKIKFLFTDGSYGQTVGYTDALFTSLNNTSENSQWFVPGDPTAIPPTHPYLEAGSIPSMVSLKHEGTSDFSYNNPTSGAEYIASLPAITSGTRTYVITVNYTAAQSTPYKSDALPSSNTIGAGAKDFIFKVTGVNVQVYDVEVGDMPSMRVGEFWHENGYIGVDVYDRNYILADDNANLILKSKYDVQENSSTGIWTGDSVSLFTKKSLYPSWTYTVGGEPVIMQLADTSYPVVSPVLYYIDGDFKPESGYPAELFQQYNPLASADSLYAQCNLTENPSIGIYKDNTEVYIQQTPYSTKVAKAASAIDPDVSVTREYALWFNGTSGTLMDTDNITLTSSGIYTLKFKVPYTANTSIPKKSNNTPSSVSIDAGILEKTSSAFTVNQEVDVSVIGPSISIEAITIDNIGTCYNGDSVDISAGTISGHYNFVVNNKEGLFTPGNSTYTNTEFNNNNNTADGKLAAGCKFTTFTLNVNGSTAGTCAGDALDSTGHGKIRFTDLQVTNDLTAQITGAHGGSTVTAKKRSTRNSSANINSTSALASNQLIIHVTMPSMRSVRLIANPSTGGTVRFSFTQAPGGESDASTMVEGTSFTAIATPAANWSFVDWTKTRPSTSGIQVSTSAEYTEQVGSIDLELYANFSAPQTSYHFVVVTTTDTDVNATTYTQVEQLLAAGNTVHCNYTHDTTPSTYTDSTTYNNPNIGVGKKVFVIAAPIEYKSASMYVGADNQQFNFTIIPAVSSDNGIPYSSSDTTVYRLFKFQSAARSGYNINKIELKKS